MTDTTLGRLQRVDLREVWANEATDFTPWLAREENIAILGETIRIDLEVEGQEKSVGPFKADILCLDTATNNWVLIENQLDRTDHTHLGQLLTYGAGLDAVTIVWIAQRFTEEHRAALDWLNEITDERFQFFGLEIECWKIGDSVPAPKFNIVSKPNDWTRTVSGAAARIKSDDLSETQELHLRYWTAFHDYVSENSSMIRAPKPGPQHWQTFAIGRSNFRICTLTNTRDSWIGVELICDGGDAKPHFYQLRDDRESIEREFGEPLKWRELKGRKQSRILLRNSDCDPRDESRWPEFHAWLVEKIGTFQRVFSQRVQSLDASDYEPQDGDEGEDDES
jgi:hypothetical protein